MNETQLRILYRLTELGPVTISRDARASENEYVLGGWRVGNDFGAAEHLDLNDALLTLLSLSEHLARAER